MLSYFLLYSLDVPLCMIFNKCMYTTIANFGVKIALIMFFTTYNIAVIAVISHMLGIMT